MTSPSSHLQRHLDQHRLSSSPDWQQSSHSQRPLTIAITRNKDDDLVRDITKNLQIKTQRPLTITGAAVTEICTFPLDTVRPYLQALGGRTLSKSTQQEASLPAASSTDTYCAKENSSIPAAGTSEYDWIVITSKNTVFTLDSFAKEIGCSLSELFGSTSLCSVGSATTTALENFGCTPAWSAQGSAASIVQMWPHQVHGNKLRIAVPGSALSKSTLSVGLENLGHHVDVMPIYTTQAVAPLPDVFNDRVHIVVALAGSSIEAMKEYLKENPHILLVTIGEPSAKVAAELGFDVTTIANSPDAEGLGNAVIYAIEKCST